MASELIRLKLDRDFSLMPWLLPARVRPEVRALDRFVRLAETVAASPLLARSERAERLAFLDAALAELEPGADPAGGALPAGDAAVIAEFRDSLARRRVTAEHARTILRTRQRTLADEAGEAGGGHATWADVLAYCRGVASPVGRHMLDLCGEDAATCGGPADALCIAMRILKELRDGHASLPVGGPPCIPASFMRDASISPRHFAAPSARGQTRAVIDRVLDGVDALLAEARRLPPLLRDRRLRVCVCVVLCRAGKLSRRFRQTDPLQETVGLSRWERHGCLALTLLRALSRP